MNINKKVTEGLKLYLSLTTGQLYEISPDEIQHLDNQQLPLKLYPKDSCRKCYGRGYIGNNSKTKEYILCSSCMRKCLDEEALKKLIEKNKAN